MKTINKIYLSFVEHKFIEQAFGKIYIDVVGFTTVLWKVPIFRQILVQQNITASFLTFVPVDEWMNDVFGVRLVNMQCRFKPAKDGRAI